MKGYTPIILILVSIGVFFFFIEPQRKELDALNAEKNKNDIMLEKSKELEQVRGILNDKYKNITAEEKEKLSKVLPDTVDNVRLILDINNIANKYGIILKGISISGGPISETSEINKTQNTNTNLDQSIGNIQFSFSFTADYNVFKTFLKDLEDSLRLVDVTDLSVSASKDGQGPYNYSLSLNTYWLR